MIIGIDNKNYNVKTMSKRKIKNRNRLGLNPKPITYKLVFDYQFELFQYSQKISKDKNILEFDKVNLLNGVFDKMKAIQAYLIKRGAKINAVYMPNNNEVN